MCPYIIYNIRMQIMKQIPKFKNEVLTKEELSELNTLNEIFNGNLKQLSDVIRKKEFERVIIEISWKSSVLEGNTYTLLETETLLKDGIEAKGKKKEEAIMTQLIILNPW